MAEQRHSPLKDDRLNDPNEHIEVVFDGSITLWRSATNLDVVLVYFEKLRCMELLVFHPVRVLEAPRIYIDFATLEKHLPRAEMQKQVEGRKELFLRRHCTYVASEIEKEVEMTTISNYVVSRIAVADGDDFIIELQAHFGDTMESDVSADGMTKQHLDFVIGKPEGLIPINTEHYAKPSIEEFQRRIYLIEADQESIKDNFTKVHKMLRIVELAVTAFRGGKLHTTNPNLTLATLRWKRAINRVINRIMCEKVRILLQKMEAEALLRRVKPHSDAYYRGINGAGALAPLTCDSLLHRKSKFENHLPKGKDYRHDEDQHHVAIRILSKASFRRSCILDATYDDNSVTTDTCSLGSMSPPESSDGLAHRSSLSNPSTDSSSFHVSPPHGLSQLDILLAQQTSSRRSSLVSPHLPPLSKGLSGIHPPPKREASQRIQLLRSFDHGKPSDLCSMPSPSSSDGASVPPAPN